MAKVLIIGSLAESLINFRWALIKRLVDDGHSVVAAAPDPPEDVIQALGGISVKCFNIPLDRTGMNPLRDLRTIRAIFSLCCRERPSIMLAYTIKPVLYGSIGAALAKIPRICLMITGLGIVFHSDTLKARVIGCIVRTIQKISVACSYKVFFQNPDDRAYYINNGLLKDKTKAVLINGSGIDLDLFQAQPIPAKISFLLIARIIEEKGIPEYVEAARRIKQKYSDVTFRLVGWFDSKPTGLNPEMVDGWVGEGVIEYLGSLADVRPALADTSVFVLPSRYREGTPRTILEALAVGRPIITSDAPGCRETVVEGVNGFLIPPGNVDALCEAMEKLITKPALLVEMGHRSRLLAEEKYDVHKVNSVIVEAMGLVS